MSGGKERSNALNPGWAVQEYAGKPLSQPKPPDEFLHPLPANPPYAWTETSYFGFLIPERDLMAEIYMWYHPALNTMSAGVLIWRGIKTFALQSEFVDHHHFLPMPVDIGHYSVPQIGLEMQVIEPLRVIESRFKSPHANVSFHVRHTGILPPLGRPNATHFVQPMHTIGELNLHGETFTIDSHFTRDRSWGAERFETPQDWPPITWMTGTADADLSFHVVAFDEPSLGPDWRGAFDMPKSGENMMWGYLHKDGTTAPITRTLKRTLREADGVSPRGFELTLEDAAGRSLSGFGFVTARVPWNTNQNMLVNYSLTRWDFGGRVAWGDCQDIFWNRYAREFSK